MDSKNQISELLSKTVKTKNSYSTIGDVKYGSKNPYYTNGGSANLYNKKWEIYTPPPFKKMGYLEDYKKGSCSNIHVKRQDASNIQNLPSQLPDNALKFLQDMVQRSQ